MNIQCYYVYADGNFLPRAYNNGVCYIGTESCCVAKTGEEATAPLKHACQMGLGEYRCFWLLPPELHWACEKEKVANGEVTPYEKHYLYHPISTILFEERYDMASVDINPRIREAVRRGLDKQRARREKLSNTELSWWVRHMEHHQMFGGQGTFQWQFLKPRGWQVVNAAERFMGRLPDYRGINTHGMYLKYELGKDGRDPEDEKTNLKIAVDYLTDLDFDASVEESVSRVMEPGTKGGKAYIKLVVRG
jgi:hypothetical protein